MRSKARLAALVMALAIVAPALVMAAPTVVQWWHIGTAANDKAMYQGWADAYTQLHPDVQIQITVLENEAFKSKLTTVMQSGSPPTSSIAGAEEPWQSTPRPAS